MKQQLRAAKTGKKALPGILIPKCAIQVTISNYCQFLFCNILIYLQQTDIQIGKKLFLTFKNIKEIASSWSVQLTVLSINTGHWKATAFRGDTQPWYLQQHGMLISLSAELTCVFSWTNSLMSVSNINMNGQHATATYSCYRTFQEKIIGIEDDKWFCCYYLFLMHLSSMNSDSKCHSIRNVFHQKAWNTSSLEWTKLFIVILMLTYSLQVWQIFLEKFQSSVCQITQ